VHHSNPELDGPAVVRAYRDAFVASPEFAEPASILVLRCVCARTEPEARSVEDNLVVPPVPANRAIVGSAEQCTARIADIAAAFSTGEVMIVDFVQKDQDARLEMYRLLAHEFGLAPRAEEDALPPPSAARESEAAGIRSEAQ